MYVITVSFRKPSQFEDNHKGQEKINLLIIPHYWLYIGNGKRLKFPTLGKARPFQKNVYATFDVYLNNTPLVIIGKNAFELLN